MTERAKQILTYILITLSSLAFVPLMAPPLSSRPADLALYFTSFTGLVGVVLLLWQYALGTRTVTGLFYRDLPWTVNLHSLLGKYGTILIFLHPVASLLAYGQNVLYMFVPDLRTSYEQTITWGRLGFVLLLFIWATSFVLRSRLKYRPWKYLHYLTYIILPATFLHSQSIGSTLLSSKPALVYWYAIIGLWALITVLRLRFFFGFGKLPFRIISSRPLTAHIHELKLQPLQYKLRIRNGQYIYLQPTLLSEEHPFSAYDFDDSGNLTVAFKRAGKFTARLSHLPVGTVVQIDGPYGAFTEEIHAADQPAVFISGGIGLTPFHKTVFESVPTGRHYFFDCNSTAADSPYGEAERRQLGPRYIRVLSRDQQTAGPNTEHGYITPAILRKHLSSPADFRYYICGPVRMMQHTHGVLRSMGIAESQIKMEKFSF